MIRIDTNYIIRYLVNDNIEIFTFDKKLNKCIANQEMK